MALKSGVLKKCVNGKGAFISHEKVPGGRWGTPNDAVYDELDRFPICLHLYNLLSVTDTGNRYTNKNEK